MAFVEEKKEKRWLNVKWMVIDSCIPWIILNNLNFPSSEHANNNFTTANNYLCVIWTFLTITTRHPLNSPLIHGFQQIVIECWDMFSVLKSSNILFHCFHLQCCVWCTYVLIKERLVPVLMFVLFMEFST